MRQSFWIRWRLPVGLSLLLICAVTGDAEPRDAGSINSPRQSPADSGSFRLFRGEGSRVARFSTQGMKREAKVYGKRPQTRQLHGDPQH